MKRAWIVVTILALLLPGHQAHAQLAGLGDTPVEITADGETHFEKGVAVADNNVQIHFEDVSIYCDHAEYNPDTRDVLLIGNVRIYSPDGLVSGQRALYNLQDKHIRALNFSGSFYPMLFRALTFYSLSQDEFRIHGTTLTTDDKSQPDYHIKAKTMRVYRNDHVVFLYSTLYVGKIPIFWFPYLPANRSKTGFTLMPGWESGWGAYVMLTYGFFWGRDNENIATTHVDYRSDHGLGLGLDSTIQLGKNKENDGFLRSYWTYDNQPTKGINGTNPINTPNNRYRISYQQHLYFSDDVYATCDLNKLSDFNMMQDFFPVEYRTNPQPDNNISLTKWSTNYTLNLLTRFQMNNFQETVQRLPEFSWDINQHNLFGTPIFFDGSNTMGYLTNAFGKQLLSKNPNDIGDPTSIQDQNKLQNAKQYPNYSAFRFDSFSQISLPKTYFGWLSVIPRFGFRGTAYNRTGSFYGPLSASPQDQAFGLSQTSINGQRYLTDWLNNPQIASNARGQVPSNKLTREGAIFRPVINFELESSFKLSHAYERAQSRFLGLDGLMHVVQPYVDYSFVKNFGPKPRDIYQFDTVEPNTQPLPISFPDFQAIDAIDSWSILRSGVRNNLITRRDNANYQWLTLDTFFDYNFLNPYVPAKIGNMNNYLMFFPSQWVNIFSNFQFPLDPNGFTQFDTGFLIMPCRNFQFSIAHSYLNHYPSQNPFGFTSENSSDQNNATSNGLSSTDRIFQDRSQITINAFYRLNDNWGFSAQEQFDTTQRLLMYQRYYIHRDLSAWVLSVGLEIRQNEGQQPVTGGLLLLTLKGAPQVTIPMGLPTRGPMGPGSSR